MSRGARSVAAACLVAMSLAAAAATAARNGAASAPAPTAPAKKALAAAPGASAPAEFEGTFTAGVTYFGDFSFDPRALKIWRPVTEVRPGREVAWTIKWTNLDQFPALQTPATQARPQRFVFRVLKSDLVSGTPALPWMATYQCEVLAVEPVPVAPIAAARVSAPRRR